MNERMEELYEQSRIGYGLGHDIEKFAELIIRECMQVSMKAVGMDAEYEAWYLIKQHFGVEE